MKPISRYYELTRSDTDTTDNFTFGLAFLLVAHPLLALEMRDSVQVSTLHAFITVAIGLIFVLFSKDFRKVSFVVAYIAGSDVLWRMTDAHIFWEGGKYFTVLLLSIALLRIKGWQQAGIPLFYLFLLSLSIPLTISTFGFSGSARDAISFNLSGSLSLAICVLYFSQQTFDLSYVQRVIWWMIFPILSVATLVLNGILSRGQIIFTDQSNFATSGGFGPNQVSALLGLGGGLMFLILLQGKGFKQRLLSLIFSTLFFILSALTFSRGGLYNAAFMLILASIHYLRNPSRRIALLGIALIVGILGGYFILPRMNEFTGGMLGERFSSLDTTLRAQIAEADLELWFTNPFLGVGPGLSNSGRLAILGREVASHTEYTRVLAEHGIAGLLALVLIIVLAIKTYFQAPNLDAKVLVAAFLGWSLMEMSHSAMRLVAISFIFGIAMVNWRSSLVDEKTNNRT